jgi:hypothetical protein
MIFFLLRGGGKAMERFVANHKMTDLRCPSPHGPGPENNKLLGGARPGVALAWNFWGSGDEVHRGLKSV